MILSVGAWAKTKDEPTPDEVLEAIQKINPSVDVPDLVLDSTPPEKIEREVSVPQVTPDSEKSENSHSYTCPLCKAELDVPDKYWGRTMKCGGCREQVVLPELPDHFVSTKSQEVAQEKTYQWPLSKKATIIAGTTLLSLGFIFMLLYIKRTQTLLLRENVSYVGKAFWGTPSGEGRIIIKEIDGSVHQFKVTTGQGINSASDEIILNLKHD